ncbi:sugar transporter ERD6-like 7 isoform X2 [Tasmannia lanceolata]|uniref:sugar transporter ERD6-like 7 isoform X2 n=1 Tax=Tasmannia lanceolata TaxID=3420 RepID=UPI0040627EA9
MEGPRGEYGRKRRPKKQEESRRKIIDMAISEDVENGDNIEQEEMREPLMKISSAREEYDNNKSSIFMVLLSTFIAVWGSFEFGSCGGYSAPAQSSITDDLGLSVAEYSFFGSILNIGAMIGAITSGRIADFFGRKWAMRISATFCAAGWIVIYFSKDAWTLDIGRFCTGYGAGVVSFVVPVFIAEITPKNLRGGLTTLNQLMICTGVSVLYIIGTFVSWRTLALTAIIPCIILLSGLFFIPESPRWLAKVGKKKEFQAALQRLRGKDADISEEATEIQDYIETLEKLPKAKMLDLFQRRYARSVIIGVGLIFFQQFGGINGFSFYVSNLFVSAGFSSGKVGTLLWACIQVPVTVMGAVFMDKMGRRPLLLISATGTFLGTFLAGISFYLKDHGFSADWVPILALVGMLIYVGSFSFGMGPVPWVIMSEIFPINVKGTAGSMVTLMHWFGAWVTSYTFNFLMSWSSSGTMFLFAGVCAITVPFIIILVPETKGKSLEEIQASMNSQKEENAK